MSGRWGAKVPPPVRAAYEDGAWLLPRVLDRRSGKWHPPFAWREYMKRRPTRAEINAWAQQYPTALWCMITGHGPERIVVAEFDGTEGATTLTRLKLKPHILSPSGSGHVRIAAPQLLVQGGSRVDPAHFPGMDLLAYGQTATFYGRRPDGRYRRGPNAGSPYTLSQLPKDLRALIKSRVFTRRDLTPAPLPEGWDDRMPRTDLLAEALLRSESSGRNATGFWLACQLRDERYTFDGAMQVLDQYQQIVERANGREPYTRGEAYQSAVQAFAYPARQPRMLRGDVEVELIANVALEKITWLWRGRIPMRKITIVEGDPDRGKSTVTLDVAARKSRGATMPDSTPSGGAGAVLIICAEDDIGDTVKPRLAAAGARQDRIGFMPLAKDEHGRVVPLSIPEDLARIERAIKSLESKVGLPCHLVIIDPITAYLSEKIGYGNDPQVRKAMLPLKQLAEEKGVAVLLVRHLNKDGSLRAMYRGGGSIAFNAASRSVLVVERHPEDETMYVLCRVKGNLGPAQDAMGFRIVGDVQYDCARIEWGATLAINVEDLLRGSDSRTDAPARDEASAFLTQLLAHGPVPYEKIEAAAKKAGHSMRTVRAAKKHLGIQSVPSRAAEGRPEVDHWEWVLPVWRDGNVIRFDFGKRKSP